MAKWKFRMCPRCGGDVFLDRDIYSWYEQYVQCGYISDLKSVDEFNKSAVESRKERAMAGTRQPRNVRAGKRTHNETKAI